jgi:hypothetical protein
MTGGLQLISSGRTQYKTPFPAVALLLNAYLLPRKPICHVLFTGRCVAVDDFSRQTIPLSCHNIMYYIRWAFLM